MEEVLSESDEIRERFGLSYLTNPQDQPSQEQRDKVGPLQAFASERELRAIQEVKDQDPQVEGVRLREVANRTGMSAEILQPISRLLRRAGLLVVIQEDTFGDDSVDLTPKAVQIL